jgi:hypothetical protein
VGWPLAVRVCVCALVALAGGGGGARRPPHGELVGVAS